MTGVEVWSETAAGTLLSRKTSAAWLMRFLGERGLKRVTRTTGEVTELYIYTGRIRGAMHLLNRLWFKLHGPSYSALGTYYLFKNRARIFGESWREQAAPFGTACSVRRPLCLAPTSVK